MDKDKLADIISQLAIISTDAFRGENSSHHKAEKLIDQLVEDLGIKEEYEVKVRKLLSEV